MGYTHYFRTKEFTDEEWNTIIESCKTLYKNMPDTFNDQELFINGCGWRKNPVFNKDCIHFNGWDGSKRIKDGQWWVNSALSCETFSLQKFAKAPSWETDFKEGDFVFNFCKTNRNPYDLMVMACLIVAKSVAPSKIIVSSDGGDREWQPAFNFVMQTVRHPKVLSLAVNGFKSLLKREDDEED